MQAHAHPALPALAAPLFVLLQEWFAQHKLDRPALQKLLNNALAVEAYEAWLGVSHGVAEGAGGAEGGSKGEQEGAAAGERVGDGVEAGGGKDGEAGMVADGKGADGAGEAADGKYGGSDACDAAADAMEVDANDTDVGLVSTANGRAAATGAAAVEDGTTAANDADGEAAAAASEPGAGGEGAASEPGGAGEGAPPEPRAGGAADAAVASATAPGPVLRLVRPIDARELAELVGPAAAPAVEPGVPSRNGGQAAQPPAAACTASDPLACIGRCVRIYWPDDDAWYAADVASYDAEAKRHALWYHVDEETEVLDMAAEEEAGR
eukprot:179878-Chlamydomonas_euryale.AAC.1